MKIGVITYWYGNSNYGMILQCWALQKYLKKLGHDPFVIRFQPKQSWWKKFIKDAIAFSRCLVSDTKRYEYKRQRIIQSKNLEKDKYRQFEDFREINLEMSQRFYQSIKDLKKRPPMADSFIAGSDQIWSNNLKSADSKGYYLDFGDKSIKRIAYAPSFGTMKYDDNNISLLASALSVFDAISCREIQGVSLCARAGYVAQKVEDPTLLLSKDDYLPLMTPTQYNDSVFIYSVNMNSASDIYWDELKRVIPINDFVITPSSGSIEGGELFGSGVKYIYATVGEWLSLIYGSRLVITSSFHGVVFSVLFNKKFCFVPLKGTYAKTNNRIIDLLNSLGLNELVVYSPEDYKRIINCEIDWASVNAKKNALLEDSVCFLDKALS